MRPRSLDLLLVNLWVVCICLTLPYENAAPPVIRTLTGTLILGGGAYVTYALISGLFADRFDAALRVALTIGIFVAVTLVIGIILNYTSGGISRPLWMIGYGLYTLISSLVALGARGHYGTTPITLKYSRAVLLVLLAGVFGISYWMARIGLETYPHTGFTEFWMLRDENNAPDGVLLGLTSGEIEPVSYRLETRSDGHLIEAWPDLELAPGETWQTTLTLPETAVDPVIGLLYRVGESEPYRRVELWRQAHP
ncbi:MAG: hypothetical protein IPO91_03140 [Chloroflexi bacterium]|nr:hypothetical protein [Chloroflexota bacterium]